VSLWELGWHSVSSTNRHRVVVPRGGVVCVRCVNTMKAKACVAGVVCVCVVGVGCVCVWCQARKGACRYGVIMAGGQMCRGVGVGSACLRRMVAGEKALVWVCLYV